MAKKAYIETRISPTIIRRRPIKKKRQKKEGGYDEQYR